MDAQKYGYRRLADFMAWESSLAIFPRFRSATMLCLLQMQAEITEIEEDLEKFAHEDGKSSDDKKKEWLRDWSSLDTTSKDIRQCKLLRLRSLLAEYSRSLVVQSIETITTEILWAVSDIFVSFLRSNSGASTHAVVSAGSEAEGPVIPSVLDGSPERRSKPTAWSRLYDMGPS